MDLVTDKEEPFGQFNKLTMMNRRRRSEVKNTTSAEGQVSGEVIKKLYTIYIWTHQSPYLRGNLKSPLDLLRSICADEAALVSTFSDGFIARLTEEQATDISEDPAVRIVFPESELFFELENEPESESEPESDV